MAKIHEQIKFPERHLNDITTFLAGIECEIESIHHVNVDLAPYFHTEADGSLRNNGCEFISIPLERETLLDKFKNLHANIVYNDKADAFSPRTSTHVHVNVRSFTEAQLKQLLLFYALFEEFFFSMVDPVRRDNIHCVPLNETMMAQRYRTTAFYMIKYWHKYTAFNMLPVTKQGTVEFRHLQGTDDEELLGRWLKTIENLWLLAQDESMTKDTITDVEHHKRWFNTIFADAPEVLALAPAMSNKIQNNLIDVKLAFA